jgi:hypothetical protein
MSIGTARNHFTSHLPTHSSREILIIFGSLTTVDPGNIYETLSSCIKDRIRISLVALAAEMKICRELCDKTGGTPPHTTYPLPWRPPFIHYYSFVGST